MRTLQKCREGRRCAYVELWKNTRHDSLPTRGALRGEGAAVAVIAEQLAVLAGEGLISEGALAAAAAEAVLVEVAILIEQLLWGAHCMGRLAPGFSHQLPPLLPSPCLVPSLPSSHDR